MVIVKAFDQAIWYLKIILPKDILNVKFSYTIPTSLTAAPIFEGL